MSMKILGEHELIEGVPRDISVLRHSCSSFTIATNLLEFVTIDTDITLPSSPSSPFARFMQLTNFRLELNVSTRFVVKQQQLKVIRVCIL
jgi:hypothetical protein